MCYRSQSCYQEKGHKTKTVAPPTLHIYGDPKVTHHNKAGGTI